MDFCGFVADSIRWAKLYYNNSEFIYRLDNQENKVYLTFDDGPTPGVTHWILDTLRKYNARATFFMIGNNMAKYPDLRDEIIAQGHAVGNHTYDHLKGFNYDVDYYVDNVMKTQELLPAGTNLFRPPYGRIKVKQAKKIMDLGLKVVLWTIVSCDYEQKASPQRIYNLVCRRIKPGSIIVFHDSYKAERNMKYALERILDEYSGKFVFDKIDLSKS